MQIARRLVILCFAASMLCLTVLACATAEHRGPVYSATAIIRMIPTMTPSEARRVAIANAEQEARHQLLAQAYQLRLSDGHALEDLAVVDPFVRAVIDDTVRRAQIADQTVSDEGILTLTLSMDLTPLYKLIADYSTHAI